MIPKKIFTIWLNGDKQIPTLINKCILSQDIPYYEHELITLDNCITPNDYVMSCLEHGNWVKAADYLRLYYLYKEGGIYLDADMEVLKSFDDLLNSKMFVCREENGFIANSVIGTEKENPIIKQCLDKVDRNFIGSGDMIFEAGMELFSNIIYANQKDVQIYPAEYFFPYNHQTGNIHTTINTHAYHHFLKSWKL